MHKIFRFLPLFTLALLMVSCEKEEQITPPSEVTHRLYVVNTLGETISMIDLDQDSVYNDLYLTGVTPAKMKYSNGSLFLVNSGDNTLQRIDLASGMIYTTEIGDYRNPAFLEFLPGGKVAITNFLTGTISLVNLSSGLVENEIPVGKGLWGMTYHNGKIYAGITNWDLPTFSYGQGRVAVIDAGTLALEDSVDVGTNPGILFVDGQGELNAVCIGDYFSVFAEVWRINPADNSVLGNFDLGGSPLSEAFFPDGTVYLAGGGWATEGYLLSYDPASETPIHGGDNPITIAGASGILGVAIASDSSIYVSSFNTDRVLKVDEGGNILKSYPVGDGPQSLIYVED